MIENLFNLSEIKKESRILSNQIMIRLLILDDDPEVRYGIYDYLKQDYEVFVTKNIKEVFKIFNQTNIDLIIFDYSIISINLKQFVVALKESNDKNTYNDIIRPTGR